MRFDTLSAGGADAVPASRLRRRLLQGSLAATALSGGGFGLAWLAPGTARAQAKDAPPPDPNAFLKILPDGAVELQVNRLEFGQGVQTALAMLVAEELDVPLERVRARLAPAADAFKDPVFGMQMTGGSTALAHSWAQYRAVGAAARAMLVAAAAERWNLPAASLKTADGSVLAEGRRASYAELAEAAARQPVPASPVLKDPSAWKIVGRPAARLDGRDTVTGAKRYGIDMKLPEQSTALIARPPVFGGRVTRFDASKALAVRGVRAVMEVPTNCGGTGLAVIASGYWPAKTARDALQVDWAPGPAAGLSTDALMAGYRERAKAPPLVAVDWPAGTDRATLDAAPRRIVAEYEFPYLAHAPMEPLNCVVDLKPDGCRVFAGTQFQTVDRQAIAQVAGLPVERVSLATLPAGGGFGRRAVPTSDYLREAVGVAKAWGKGPVKVVWSREDDIRGGHYRPAHVHRVEVGLDPAGAPVAWDHAIVGQSILKGTPFEPFLVKKGIDGTMTEGVAENDYGLPMRLRVAHPDVPVPVLWWRSVGHTHTAFVMETMADELARAAGQDPVAWRLARLEGKHPRHAAALRLAVERSGYGKRALPAGRAWGVAVHESFGSVVAYVAEASVEEDRPVVHAVTAGVHCNQVVNPLTATAQVQGALVFGLSMTLPGNAITLKDGMVEQSQFSDYTPARMTDAPPRVDVHFVPSQDPPTGMGEPGVPPIAPAVANAVATLTGKRLRKLPFDLANA